MPNSRIAVFDTNVVIPLILPASRSARLFLRLQSAGWQVAISWPIVAEVKDKLMTKQGLRQWLGLPDDRIHRFLQRLPTVCLVVSGLQQAHGAVKADPKDDMVIAAALEAQASYVVSEDKHLLDLGTYQEIAIMNRQQFDAELDRLGVPK